MLRRRLLVLAHAEYVRDMRQELQERYGITVEDSLP